MIVFHVNLPGCKYILVEALKDNDEDESSSIMHRGWGTLEGGRLTSHLKGSSDRLSSMKLSSGAKVCGTQR